jgi:putative FmdB family regulatory protein
MPIYAYRCDDCGYAKDVLQKMSDPQLTVCLSCGKPTFKKQLTAAGFQLKGTGWYATDFRGTPTPAVPAAVQPAATAATPAAAPAPAATVVPAAATAAPAAKSS